MTNATMQKRLTKLEAEMKLLKKTVTNRPDFSMNEGIWREASPIVRKINARALPVVTKKKAKKLPQWLQASLKDIEEGRVYGPFDTVRELRASLESKGS